MCIRDSLQVNDGAGADTAITLGKNGKVTKIGDDTPSDGQLLTWDSTAGKVKWDDGVVGISGSSVHYSGTELRTSGDLNVSGSSTLAGDVLVGEYIKHSGDTDTFIRMQTDGIRLEAGGRPFIRINETTQDSITFNEDGEDVDFNIQTTLGTTVFVEGAGGAVNISGALGPLSGSGEIHATGFTGNDANLSGSLTLGVANAVGSQIPLTINRSGSTQAAVIVGGMTASHDVHVEHLYTNDLYVSGTTYGITVDRANYASASDPGTGRTYSPTGFETSGYLYAVSYTHLRAHETLRYIGFRLMV